MELTESCLCAEHATGEREREIIVGLLLCLAMEKRSVWRRGERLGERLGFVAFARENGGPRINLRENWARI